MKATPLQPRVAAGVLLVVVAVAIFGVPSGPAHAQAGPELADFDRAGLAVEALALFTAGDTGDEPALYSAAGSLGPDAEAIVRVLYVASYDGGAVLRLNDAGPLVLREYFGPGGAGNDLTVWVQTAGSTVRFPASGVRSVGGNYVNFGVGAAAAPVLGGIAAGDRFILALTRPAPAPTVTATSTATATGTPSATASPPGTPKPASGGVGSLPPPVGAPR